ncbi:MAG: universal stress protein [bacterium]|nr:universal stress protein [bacterium]
MDWPPKRILLGSDFSASADAAHAVARAFAYREGSDLHLLHVAQDPVHVLTGYKPLDRILDYAASYRGPRTRSVEQLCARARELGGPDLKTHVRTGDPVAQMVAFREQIGADLLVLGATGLRGFRRLLLGSVSERMLREPGCPLLLVNRSPAAGEVKRILVAMELPDLETPALKLAVGIAHDLRGELILLHALPPRGYISDRRHVELHAENAAPRMRAVAAAIDPTIPVETVVRSGIPEDVIQAVASEIDAHLTVMGVERNQSDSPGRVVDHVVRAGLDAVLLVWPEDGEERE